jgi:hypothetical protein
MATLSKDTRCTTIITLRYRDANAAIEFLATHSVLRDISWYPVLTIR